MNKGQDQTQDKTQDIQILRTIANQIIIGTVTYKGDTVIINLPYNIMPTQEGLQLYPMDAEIIGKELEYAEIDKQNTIYITTPGEQLIKSYKKALKGLGDTGIQEDEKLILG